MRYSPESSSQILHCLTHRLRVIERIQRLINNSTVPQDHATIVLIRRFFQELITALTDTHERAREFIVLAKHLIRLISLLSINTTGVIRILFDMNNPRDHLAELMLHEEWTHMRCCSTMGK